MSEDIYVSFYCHLGPDICI